jgi:hypothetical protein
MSCTRELYWDDTTSLGAKYDLVNRDNLRGVGIWNLNYGGGAPELWATLNSYFACNASLNVPQSPGTTEFTIGLSAGSCSVSYYDVQQFDSTTNQGWFWLPQVSGGSPNLVVEGYPGHSYVFQARAHSSSGLAGQWGQAGTTVASTASYSKPFRGLYTMDAYGGINANDSPPLAGSAYWSGWKVACSARTQPGPNSPQSGLVLDCYGGLHPYGAPGLTETSAQSTHYWGWNIARDVAFMPNGVDGLVLDGWGGLHPFHLNGSTTAMQIQGNAYWPGWDIARKVIIWPDGSGGVVMDAWGGLHSFGVNGSSIGAISQSAYWPGWNIARDVVSNSGIHSGYVLDGWGGIHPFHAASDGSAMPGAISPGGYWPGWDIARALYFLPHSSTAGYTLDGWGGTHPFGGAPPITRAPYWPGRDIAKSLAGY